MSPTSGTPQSKFGNVYYHYKVECVLMQQPDFQKRQLQVIPKMVEKLSNDQKELVFMYCVQLGT